MAKVSIITVVLNAESSINHTIQSVLAQTYQDFEFIIMDGGSTDQTLNIIKQYQHVNLIWQSEPDNGIYDAMNKGLKKATGEWLYFLGADDTFYSDDVLYKVFRNEEKLDCDFLYGNIYSLLNKKKYDGKFDKSKILFSNICHQSIFYRKSVFEKFGYYNPRYKIYADWDINIKCFYNNEIKIRYIEIIVANFAGGISAIKSDLIFLRNSLFPTNLKILKHNGLSSLYNLVVYDKWWRLIRSMELTDKKDKLSEYISDDYIPIVINQMHSFQKKIPDAILHTGIFSKSLMFYNYLLNVLTFKFKYQDL